MSSVVIAGDISGSITIAAPATAGSNTLTLPVATDTLVGKATTDTLTNKTLTSPVINGAATGTGVATAATSNTLVMRGAAGEITGSAGSFSTLSATGGITSNNAAGQGWLKLDGAATATTYVAFQQSGVDKGVIQYTNATSSLDSTVGAGVTKLSSTGLAVTGAISATGAITLQGNGSIMGTAGTSVSTSAVSITTTPRDYGTLSIVVGNSGGNIFSDLVYWGTTFGAVVMQSKTVSGGPVGRTYSVASSILRVAMASGTYSVTTNSFSGAP
jgi:hypothetical protein